MPRSHEAKFCLCRTNVVDSTADELAVTASFDSLPEEVARIVLGYLGYHQTPAASEVCKTWHKSPALVAARVLRRRSLEAAPASVPRPWRIEAPGAREYLSLDTPSAPGENDVLYHLREGEYGGEIAFHLERDDHLFPTSQKILLRTRTDQCCTYSFVVVIDKTSGEVLVYEHPNEDDNGAEIEFRAKQNFCLEGHKLCFIRETFSPRAQLTVQTVEMGNLKLLERYEAVGVFVGFATFETGEGGLLERDMYTGELILRPRFADSILVQLPMTDPAKPLYPYVRVGGSCCSFATPEPITRYFASIDGMNSSHSQTMLSSTNAYYFKTSDDKLVVAYAPRDTFRRSRSEGRLGETTWELLSAWNHPGAKFLETLTKHPTARWSFCT